ncbi:MAG: hypothetical protein R6V12_13360 [Candidatus Hydrogenedentota bacterium]
MNIPREMLKNAAIALGVWVGLGFAVGAYHYLTRFGRSEWPLPTPEAAASLLAMRFNGPLPVGLDDWTLLLLVPAAGVLWVSLLFLTSSFFGGFKSSYTETLKRFALCSAHLAIGGILLTVAAWYWKWGFWWSKAAWVEGPFRILYLPGREPPWSWLGAAFMVAGGVTLGAQCAIYTKCFQVPGKHIVPHVLTAAALLAAVAAAWGPLADVVLNAFS